jgi:hypothetical protein
MITDGCGVIAQLVAHLNGIEGVRSSNLLSSITILYLSFILSKRVLAAYHAKTLYILGFFEDKNRQDGKKTGRMPVLQLL